MKMRLTILLAGVIFLATSMLAMAGGSDRHHEGPKQYKSWAKDRHGHNGYRSGRLQHRVDRLEDKLDRQRHITNHFNHRAQRLRWGLHHERHSYGRHYFRPHAYRSPVVYGFPNLVFHIDW